MSILEHLYENVFTYVREQGAYKVSTDIDEVKKIKDKIICSEAVSEETLCHIIGMANMLVYHANMSHEIDDFKDKATLEAEKDGMNYCPQCGQKTEWKN